MTGFFDIAAYLSRFKTLDIGGGKIKRAAIQKIKDIAGVSIEEKEIEIKNAVVFLSISPVEKNEIFYKKKEITAILETEGFFVKDIK